MEALTTLSEDSRLWIYGFKAPLSQQQRGLVSERLDGFMASWNTHGDAVAGGWCFIEDRFVAVAGHNPGGVSGCSIDSSVENFKWLKENHDLDGLDRTMVFYRDGSGAVQTADRPSFQQMVDAGEVSADTVVFDTTLTTVGDLRGGRFETTFADCWHARLFKIRPVAGETSSP